MMKRVKRRIDVVLWVTQETKFWAVFAVDPKHEEEWFHVKNLDHEPTPEEIAAIEKEVNGN